MIDRDRPLPLPCQAQAMGISRGSVYYLPRPTPLEDLELIRRIDQLHLEHPFAGSRMLCDLLRQDGVEVGRKHVCTLMRRMGIEALYREPNTSRRDPQHRVYPYLLRGLAVTCSDRAWAMDITSIPLARGFLYLGDSAPRAVRCRATNWCKTVRRAGNEAFQALVCPHPSRRVARTVSAWSR